MKDNECRELLQTSLKWQIGAFLLWNTLLVYLSLCFSHILIFYPPERPPIALFARFYLLAVFLVGFKYLTFTNFPDVSSSKDEFRKLFTSLNAFHVSILGTIVVYSYIFKEFGVILGFYRISYWGSSYSWAIGTMSSLTHLLRHQYLNYWYDPPFSRLAWVTKKVPETLLFSIVLNIVTMLIMNVFWILFKFEVPGFEYWSYGVFIVALDLLMARVLQNFLASPIKLDDENYLGEELCISGLTTKDGEIHFQCLQDLNRASVDRRAHIVNSNIQQWDLLLETCIKYMQKVPRHIQSYSTLKSKDIHIKPQQKIDDLKSLIVPIANFLYFIFNEHFEVKFRNDLFKLFTMAALSSKVVTKFITTPQISNSLLKNNALSLIVQTQTECLLEVQNYMKNDKEINAEQFISSITGNLRDIKKVYHEYASSISLRGEAMQVFSNIVL